MFSLYNTSFRPRSSLHCLSGKIIDLGSWWVDVRVDYLGSAYI